MACLRRLPVRLLTAPLQTDHVPWPLSHTSWVGCLAVHGRGRWDVQSHCYDGRRRGPAPCEAIVNPSVKGSGRATLPKWDDKNWKGFTHKPGGVFKSASSSAAPKQNR